MVCENCGYNNRDGVEFCRHCGISLKEKSRRTVKVKAVNKTERYKESGGYSYNPRNKHPLTIARDEDEERAPGSGKSFRTATVIIGIFVIACVIAFCLFAFDILELPGTGGSITVNSSAVQTDILPQEPTPALTPVPTIAPSGVQN